MLPVLAQQLLLMWMYRCRVAAHMQLPVWVMRFVSFGTVDMLCTLHA